MHNVTVGNRFYDFNTQLFNYFRERQWNFNCLVILICFDIHQHSAANFRLQYDLFYKGVRDIMEIPTLKQLITFECCYFLPTILLCVCLILICDRTQLSSSSSVLYSIYECNFILLCCQDDDLQCSDGRQAGGWQIHIY